MGFGFSLHFNEQGPNIKQFHYVCLCLLFYFIYLKEAPGLKKKKNVKSTQQENIFHPENASQFQKVGSL